MAASAKGPGIPGACLSLVLALVGCTAQNSPVPTAALGSPTAPGSPAVRACPGSSARDVGDIDGDGVADPVVATFGTDGGGPSYLDVHNSTAAEQLIGGAQVGVGAYSLGEATLVVDVTRDGCADVVTLGNDGIYIIPGSVDGLVPRAAKWLADPDEDGGWGTSIAVLKSPRLLAVGAPWATKSPHHGGAVFLYPLADDGTPGEPTVIHQDSPGIPGDSEDLDAFGFEIAADGNLLAIGAPSETENGKQAAGAVTLLKFTGAGLGFSAVRWTQNTAGFAARAEANDQFGSALAVRGNYVAIGVPEEDRGRAMNAGMVHVVTLTADPKPTVAKVETFDQDSPGVPDTSETNDHWGSAVALAANVGCTPMTVVVGASGERLEKVYSGAVTLVGLGAPCADQLLPMATFGVPFRYFGRRIVTLSSATATEPDVVLVGDAFSRAIGEDIPETGNVVAVRTVGPRQWTAEPVPPRDGYHSHANYGQSLGVASHG
jgi:hypothetical protein